MTKQIVNVGAVANDRTGDTWRDALIKVNDNFNEVYSLPSADCYLTTLETVTIAAIGTYVAVSGTNWLFDVNESFTISTSGLITYTGTDSSKMTIVARSNIAKVGGGTDKICTKIALNGAAQNKTVSCTDSATSSGVTSQGLFTLSTGHTLQLFVGNEDSTDNIEVSTVSIIVSGAL